MTDHYQTLGVEPTATADEIKAAYRKLAQANHPDKQATQDESEAAHEAMAAINRAYEVLSHPEKRRNYDAGHDDVSEMDAKVAKAVVEVISKALEMAGNMLTNARYMITTERAALINRIAEHKMLVVRYQKRRDLVKVAVGVEDNIAHMILDGKIDSINQGIAQIEKHLLLLDTVEENLKDYSDDQPDPNVSINPRPYTSYGTMVGINGEPWTGQ